MCTINEYVSSTGCCHNVDVFSRCAKATKEGQVRCDSTYIAKPSSLDNKRCEHCEINEKNEASQDPKLKPNRAKDLFNKLLRPESKPRRIESERSKRRFELHVDHHRRIGSEPFRRASSFGSSPPKLQERNLMDNGRWKGQGIRKKRPKPGKKDRIEYDDVCVDYRTMELDHGESKENKQPK